MVGESPQSAEESYYYEVAELEEVLREEGGDSQEVDAEVAGYLLSDRRVGQLTRRRDAFVRAEIADEKEESRDDLEQVREEEVNGRAEGSRAA